MISSGYFHLKLYDLLGEEWARYCATAHQKSYVGELIDWCCESYRKQDYSVTNSQENHQKVAHLWVYILQLNHQVFKAQRSLSVFCDVVTLKLKHIRHSQAKFKWIRSVSVYISVRVKEGSRKSEGVNDEDKKKENERKLRQLVHACFALAQHLTQNFSF